MKFETERLNLKILSPDHAKLVLDFHLANRKFVKEWAPIRDESFFTLPYQRSNLEVKDSKKSLRLYVFKKEDDSKIIGDIGYSNIVHGAFQSCHLGYSMLHSEINKGYISEALEVANHFIFNTLRLHRIEANVIPRNAPSIKVLEKLDFENEGLRKTYLKINGIWEDHISFVKFREG